MELLGSEVRPVETGQKTLKDAINDAFRDWMGSVQHTHYIIGSVMGAHPFPMIVRDFQSVIGRETREQILASAGRLPDMLVACVGGGSNAAGTFAPFFEDAQVQMVGVEAGGESMQLGRHAATLMEGRPGIIHGMQTYVLQDDDGQTSPVHSVSAGLDYPGVGPEHSYWKDAGRVEYVAVTDDEALAAFQLLSETEGIIPALEPSHAVAEVCKRAPELPKDAAIVMCLSGRGDKDCVEVARLLGKHIG